jgi:vacuolar-type H+-ATPase subunit F/Vma7
MSSVVALGEIDALEGFVLAGVTVVTAATDAEISTAWQGLDTDVGLLILSVHAAQVLEPVLAERPDVLTVVAP